MDKSSSRASDNSKADNARFAAPASPVESLSSSETKVARQSIRSTFLLFAGSLGSTLIVAVASLVIARLLAPAGYGEYSLALIIPSVFQLLVSFGTNSAVTRYAAYHLSRGEEDAAKRITKSGMLFVLIVGAMLSLANYLGAGFFASFVFQRPSLVPYIEAASFIVLAQATFQYSYYSFIGWKSPGLASASSIVQSTVKLALSPLLIVLGFGVAGAVYAHVASYAFTGAFAACLVYIAVLRKPGNLGDAGILPSAREFAHDVKQMISYGIPVHIGNFISMFSQQWFVVIILSAIASNATVGFYQAAFSVTTSITLISSSLAFALFPAFAELDGTSGHTRLAFTYAVKYISYFMTPMVFFLIGASSTIVEILYGFAYLPTSAYFLDLLAISALPLALGLTVMPPFFNGVGRTRYTMYVNIAGAAVIFALGPLLGDMLGPQGLLLSLITSNLAAALCGVFLARRNLGANIDYRTGARIFFAADVCFLVLYYLPPMLPISSHAVLLIFDLAVYFGLYLTLAPILRVVRREDLSKLRDSSEGSGFIGRKILLPILKFEMFVLEKTSGRTEKK